VSVSDFGARVDKIYLVLQLKKINNRLYYPNLR